MIRLAPAVLAFGLSVVLSGVARAGVPTAGLTELPVCERPDLKAAIEEVREIIRLEEENVRAGALVPVTEIENTKTFLRQLERAYFRGLPSPLGPPKFGPKPNPSR